MSDAKNCQFAYKQRAKRLAERASGGGGALGIFRAHMPTPSHAFFARMADLDLYECGWISAQLYDFLFLLIYYYFRLSPENSGIFVCLCYTALLI
jgi:hypothetical protein